MLKQLHTPITCACGELFIPALSWSGIIQSRSCPACRFKLELSKRKLKLSTTVEVDVKVAKKVLKSKIATIPTNRKVDYSQKPISKLLNILTDHFNLFIRNRDRLQNNTFYCPTCKKFKVIESDNYQACHCFPSTYSALRFNENNVYGGCKSCNYFKHGAGHEYNDWVRNRIGEENYTKLLILKDVHQKWDRFSLIQQIEYYKIKNKEYLLTNKL